MLAGFVNVPRIKGSHNAILSGHPCCRGRVRGGGRGTAAATTCSSPIKDAVMQRAWIWTKDLKRVRNVKPLWSRFGTQARRAPCIGGADMWLNTIISGVRLPRLPWTLKHKQARSRDAEAARTDSQKDRLPQARRRADLRQAHQRIVPVERPTTRRTSRSTCSLTDPTIPVARRRCRNMPNPPSATARRAVYEIVKEADRQRALPDQRAELRPLQNLRYQGSVPEHQLGGPGGWRRAKLSQHVGTGRTSTRRWRKRPTLG